MCFSFQQYTEISLKLLAYVPYAYSSSFHKNTSQYISFQCPSSLFTFERRIVLVFYSKYAQFSNAPLYFKAFHQTNNCNTRISRRISITSCIVHTVEVRNRLVLFTCLHCFVLLCRLVSFDIHTISLQNRTWQIICPEILNLLKYLEINNVRLPFFLLL